MKTKKRNPEGAALNCLNNALVLAVTQGRRAEVEALLDQGASVDYRDHRGRTPLMIAAMNGDEAIAEVLLQHGANVVSRSMRLGGGITYAVEGHSAIRYAMIGGNPRIISMLLGRLAA